MDSHVIATDACGTTYPVVAWDGPDPLVIIGGVIASASILASPVFSIGTRTPESGTRLRLMEFLRERGGSWRNADLARELNIAPPTSWVALQGLLAAGEVRRHGTLWTSDRAELTKAPAPDPDLVDAISDTLQREQSRIWTVRGLVREVGGTPPEIVSAADALVEDGRARRGQDGTGYAYQR